MTAAPHAAGPQELLRLKSQHLMPSVYHFFKDPPHIVAGSGAKLLDHQGRSYIDCVSGVGVMNAGHCQSEIIDPVIEQIRTLQHTTSIFLTEPQLRLAEALTHIAPAPLTRSFFCASGSEAVEGALLMAMQHTCRRRIIAMHDGLHGRTRLGMNVTGMAMWRSDPFPSGDVVHVPFGDVNAMRAALERNFGEIAAVIGEPVQGNGGIQVPPTEYWPAVRALCDEHGTLLVLDEIQTGFNRTGAWFACAHWNVEPDCMTISKGLGNGFPIAAFMTTDAIAADKRKPSASTYGGNPVCATAALATIEFHRRHRLALKATVLGEQLHRALDNIAKEFPALFHAPRGMGLMLGMPVIGRDTAHSSARCDVMLEHLKGSGVLAGKTGAHRNVLTFMPPLVITDAELQQVVDALQAVANRLTDSR